MRGRVGGLTPWFGFSSPRWSLSYTLASRLKGKVKFLKVYIILFNYYIIISPDCQKCSVIRYARKVTYRTEPNRKLTERRIEKKTVQPFATAISTFGVSAWLLGLIFGSYNLALSVRISSVNYVSVCWIPHIWKKGDHSVPGAGKKVTPKVICCFLNNCLEFLSEILPVM